MCGETIIGDAVPGENKRHSPTERLPVDQECVIRPHASVKQYRIVIVLRGGKIDFVKEKIVCVNWVSVITAWHIRILLTEERFPIYRVAGNIVNYPSWRANVVWSFNMRNGRDANNSSPHKLIMLRTISQNPEHGLFLGHDVNNRKRT